jgi:hypothetical protein
LEDYMSAGGDGDEGNVLTLLPKPPRDAAGNVATSLPGCPEPWCAI